MTKLRRTGGTIIVALILLGGLGLGPYVASKFLLDAVGHLTSRLAVMMTIGSLELFFASLFLLCNVHRATYRQRVSQHHFEKASAYQVFVDLRQEIIRDCIEAPDLSDGAESEELLALDRLLIVYGSPNVVRTHADLRRLERKSGLQDRRAQTQLIKVLLEMRKDLSGDAHELAVEDLQQLLAGGRGDSHHDS